MQRLSEEKIAIGLLTFFAIWLFVDLPIAFAQPPPTQTQEATEYWTVTGLHLKITDTLIAVFTALLFFATAALFLATKNLVRGAEITPSDSYVHTCLLTPEQSIKASVSGNAKSQ